LFTIVRCEFIPAAFLDIISILIGDPAGLIPIVFPARTDLFTNKLKSANSPDISAGPIPKMGLLLCYEMDAARGGDCDTVQVYWPLNWAGLPRRLSGNSPSLGVPKLVSIFIGLDSFCCVKEISMTLQRVVRENSLLFYVDEV